jgi:hypothetical protein
MPDQNLLTTTLGYNSKIPLKKLYSLVELLYSRESGGNNGIFGPNKKRSAERVESCLIVMHFIIFAMACNRDKNGRSRPSDPIGIVLVLSILAIELESCSQWGTW